MKNYLVKFFSIIGIIFISFFVNKLSVNAAGFNESIQCVYAVPIDYNIGVVERKDSDEVIITYEGTNDDYKITINSTFNEIAKNKSFSDNGFYKYIIGEKNGSKEKRGKEYRTCPSYVRFQIAFTNYQLDPITFSTYKTGLNQTDMSSEDYMIGSGMYATQGVTIKNNAFAVSKSSNDNIENLNSIKKEEEPYYLYLKSQRIDGKDVNSKAVDAFKSYYKYIYGFSGDNSSSVSSSKTLTIGKDTIKIKDKLSQSGKNIISLKKDYINIDNYSFEDYNSFKKYALSSFSSVKRESADSNITKNEWVNRQKVFYYIDNYTNLMSFLQNNSPYNKVYTSTYKDTAYSTITYLINISSKKNAEKSSKELDDRTVSDDAANKNICVEICSNSTGIVYTGTALTQCQASSLYKKCNQCVKRCNGVPGGEHEKCMNTCYGTNEYKGLLEKKQKNKEKLEKIQDKLYSVSAPKLNIDFDYKYVPDCDDFQELHTIYNILRIIAPILVILFGTLDYAKAVIASDVEKIEKSKKQFPKRLILLVLFIMIPFIISFLIGTFSSLDTNIAKCIVNGK